MLRNLLEAKWEITSKSKSGMRQPHSHIHKINLSKLYFNESYLMAKVDKNAVYLSLGLSRSSYHLQWLSMK